MSGVLAPERLLEIAAAGYERQDRVGRYGTFRIEEAVDGFVHRAVAADRDDLGMAFA